MTTDPAVRPHAHFGDDYSPDRCAWTGLDGTKCDVPLRQSATTTDPAVQAAAEAMHDAYEARAAEVGWETQARSRVAWADVPEANKQAMYAAVAAARPIIEAEAQPVRRSA